MAEQPYYRTQAFVPITQDHRSFEERQKSLWDDQQGVEKVFPMKDDILSRLGSLHDKPMGGVGAMGTSLWDRDSGSVWENMQSRMDKRRKQWEDEVDRMRRDFFKLRPSDRLSSERDSKTTNGGSILSSHGYNETGQLLQDDGQGNSKFSVSFDVSQFIPEEISVRTQDGKLIVHAKHEEQAAGKTTCREFSRQVDLPHQVDPERLKSTMSKDGILQVEAPVPACKSTLNIHIPPTEGQKPQGAATYTSPPPSQSAFKPVRSGSMSSPGYSGSMPSPGYSGSMSSPGYSGSMSNPGYSGSMPSPAGYKTGPILTEQDGARKLKMTVEIGTEFGPEEVLVKTVDRKLQITAKHEEKKEGRTMMREFSKELELPSSVDPNSVTASMTDDGRLVIEAPMSGYTKGSYTGAPGSTKQPEISVTLK